MRPMNRGALADNTLLGDVLALQDIWHRLTKPQRRALLAEYHWLAHTTVLNNLRTKGLINDNDILTDLGRAVVRWRPRKDERA